jgi:TatA/E family protein of Tat protein translocase
MLDIGFQELAVIMVLALLIFGPDKLPELGKRLGRAMREFRRASDEFRSTVEQNLQINADVSPSAYNPPSTEPPSTDASEATGAASQVSEPATREPAPEGQVATEPIEPFWASRGGRLLHRRECAWRGRIPESERTGLKTAQDGWDQGLKPCPACDPKEAEVTS